MIKVVGKHFYGDDENIWQVSNEAMADMDANWSDGCANVTHPDWWELFNQVREMVNPDGHAFRVHVLDGEGEFVHVGSISCYGCELTLS